MFNPMTTAHLKPSIQYNLTFGMCMKYGQEVGTVVIIIIIKYCLVVLQGLTNTIWMIVQPFQYCISNLKIALFNNWL